MPISRLQIMPKTMKAILELPATYKFILYDISRYAVTLSQLDKKFLDEYFNNSYSVCCGNTFFIISRKDYFILKNNFLRRICYGR